MKILIIEGPDLSGKTTAIETIAKHYNSGFILKNSYKPRSGSDNYKIFTQYDDIFSILLEWDRITHQSRMTLPFYQQQVIILDRYYPSQCVYSILRDEDHMKAKRLLSIEGKCCNIGVKYIYIDTPIKELEKRYDERGDSYVKKEQLLMLKKRYDTFYEQTHLNKVKIDTMEDDWLSKVINFVGD